MTRLKNSDICDISSRLGEYDLDLFNKTGRNIFGIACHTCGLNEIDMKDRARSFIIHVVPITAGQGVISDFSETVCAILRFLGFNALVSGKPDTSGISLAFEQKADAIMMADDERFVGINLKTRYVADNSEMTGRVFAAVLDLMAKGIRDKDVLVMGCGPVGEASARAFLKYNARLSIYDSNFKAALSLKEKLLIASKDTRINIHKKESIDFSNYKYILEATPSENTIPESQLSGSQVSGSPNFAHKLIAAPGVPLGISANSAKILKDGLVHDKLELGVAAMAVSLLK